MHEVVDDVERGVPLIIVVKNVVDVLFKAIVIVFHVCHHLIVAQRHEQLSKFMLVGVPEVHIEEHMDLLVQVEHLQILLESLNFIKQNAMVATEVFPFGAQTGIDDFVSLNGFLDFALV